MRKAGKEREEDEEDFSSAEALVTHEGRRAAIDFIVLKGVSGRMSHPSLLRQTECATGRDPPTQIGEICFKSHVATYLH